MPVLVRVLTSVTLSPGEQGMSVLWAKPFATKLWDSLTGRLLLTEGEVAMGSGTDVSISP